MKFKNSTKLAVLNLDNKIVSASAAFQEFFKINILKDETTLQDIFLISDKDIINPDNDLSLTGVNLRNDPNEKVDLFFHNLKDTEDNILAVILTVHNSKLTENTIGFDHESLCHLDRLTHIGKLSANIAHEIGNPLGGILAAAHGLKGKLKNNSEIEYIDMIIDDIASIKNTIESLRDFARRSKPNFIKSDLREVLKRTLFLVMPEIQKKKIDFKKIYPEEALLLKADPEQLRQVFLNILLNAVAAVNEKDSISLEVISKKRDNGKDYFLITIKDSGHGMLPNELTEIFKPFFTTKAKGLGLGLPVTKKIVEDHDGYIEVESDKDIGTQFKIYLLKEKV
ncbi:MAG: GHKL domain-containing protein [Candidatus Aureabacteria bacterium]|nr:GHKL domain-containing protein [Candidatus Auribacterota bacterium]